jgi:hypothetical protein
MRESAVNGNTTVRSSSGGGLVGDKGKRLLGEKFGGKDCCSKDIIAGGFDFVGDEASAVEDTAGTNDDCACCWSNEWVDDDLWVDL